MISPVRGRIRRRTGGCWGWGSAMGLTVNRKRDLTQSSRRNRGTADTERNEKGIMTANPVASDGKNRRLRLGMVGGGPGAFIGAVHRIAARMDDRFELVAGALSSDPAKSKAAALELHIAPERAYGSFTEMAAAEAKRPDCIDAVSIVTPNHVHFGPAKAFLEAGIHVICDKPLTTTVEDALALAAIARKSGLIFGLTHNYTGYPLVRQAREMIAAGEVGRIRVVQVEYAQDWLTTAVEATGQKQAVWRTDPAQSGPAGSLGDIGTHAYNIACFVTGLACEQVAAEVSTFVPGRRLDDDVEVLLRFEGGARGMLWASQVATGNENNLRLRVYGDKAGLEWGQENPNYLRFTSYGRPPVTISRAGAGATASAKHASRIPAGHPEGYLEAFAQLYADLAEQIAARNEGRAPATSALLVPGVKEGVEGVQFIDGVLKSSKQNSAWVKIPA
jgi:predicted dehydrogenase